MVYIKEECKRDRETRVRGMERKRKDRWKEYEGGGG